MDWTPKDYRNFQENLKEISIIFNRLKEILNEMIPYFEPPEEEGNNGNTQ